MKRKFTALVFMFILLGTLLAGCSKFKKDTPVDSDAVEEEVETETVEPEAEKEPESEPEEKKPVLTYAEENKLEFQSETSFALKGIRLDPEHPEEYEVIDTDVEISDVTVEDAEEKGYQIISIELMQSGEIRSNGDDKKLVLGFSGIVLCDSYTGRIVPGADTDEDMQIESQAELEWEGESYTIRYQEDISWDQGGGIRDEENGYISVMTESITCKVTIPKDYDGLVLFFQPVNEYREQEIGVVQEEEKYILDEWEDGCLLIRVSDLIEKLGK